MAYIGLEPSNSFVSLKRQVITGDGTASYTLDHSVASVNDVAIFVNNVRQDPAGYSISGAALTLGGTIQSSDDCYVIFLGQALQTVTPGGATITGSMLNNSLISDKTALGATPADTDEFLVSDAGTLKRVDYSHIKHTNTPAFFAHSASDQGSVSDNTYVKVTLGTEVFDVGGCFASSRFTVPSGEAGKYFLYGSVRCQVGGNSDMNNAYGAFYLNGSRYMENRLNFQANPGRLATQLIHAVLDLSVGDYVELYAAIDHAGSYAIEIGTGEKGTNFGGYKIIE